jgi:hypothetical protein
MRYERTRTPVSSRRHGPFMMLVAIPCAVAIVACGSSGTTHRASSSNRAAQGIKFADCMRSHGVPNFPDPSSGGGIQIPAGSGINPFSPSFKSAQAGCANLLPGGGPGAQHPSAQEKAQMVQTSECMRRHGVSGFPDPTLSLPSSPAGYSSIEDRGGIVLAIPDTINVGSPVFRQAAVACGLPH